MEEKNELNDIILSKGGSSSNSKKLLLAIAALTLILIIVLVIMNSLKTQSEEQPPQVAIPPEPTAPTEIIDDPLFEPVEVIQEGAGNVSQSAGEQDLGQIAQKIKQESIQNTPSQESVVVSSTVAPQSLPAPQPKASPAVVVSAPKAVAPQAAPVQKAETPAKPAAPLKASPATETKKSAPPAPKPAAAPKPSPASEAKQALQNEPKGGTESVAKTEPKALDATGTYYIQVGSFTKEPSKVLFDRLNASGLKYTTVPSGAATKVMVGPFQGEKAARDVLGTVKRNIESGAYITKG